MSIRRAVAADAAAIASVSVRGWQVAYRGLLPDAYLDALSIAERRLAWHHYLVRELPGYRMWVIEEDDAVLGFTRTGPAADADAGPEVGQVFGLYVDPRHFGTGLGRALLQHALDDLRRRGYREAIVWAFQGNERAARLYRRAGLALDGATRTNETPGYSVPEERYRTSLVAASRSRPARTGRLQGA